jgi:hypothetical protein
VTGAVVLGEPSRAAFFGLQELCLAKAAPINDLLLVSGTRFAREKSPSSIFPPTVLSRTTACSLGIK